MQHHLKEMAKFLYQGLRINTNGYGITSSITSMNLVIWTQIVLRRVDMNQTKDDIRSGILTYKVPRSEFLIKTVKLFFIL